MPILNIPDIISNTKAAANDINSRIAKIVDVLNGNLDSANIANNAITRGKIATEAVTQDNIDWDGQGIILHQTFGAGNTVVRDPVPFAQLPSLTVPMRSGYSYKIYLQARQFNMLNPAPGTINLRFRQGTGGPVLGHGTLAFETSNHSYVDPTIEVSGYFRATTTGNVTVAVEMSYNRADWRPGVGHIISQKGGYALVECVGKVNV